MMLFIATIIGEEVNLEAKIRDMVSPKAQLGTVNIVVKGHDQGNCPAFGKEYSKCGRKNHFKAVHKSNGSNDKQDQSRSRTMKDKKGKKFHEINESENNEMDDLVDQVQSLFYHDVYFNNVNMRMHTELGCEMSQNRSKQMCKIDTGADGNLMPITIFTKLYPRLLTEVSYCMPTITLP